MRLRMLETRRGTEDGRVVRQFMAGETYDIADSLARAFLAAGFAIRSQEDRKSPKKPRRSHALL